MQNEEINIDNENAVVPSFHVLDKWLKKKKRDDLSMVCI